MANKKHNKKNKKVKSPVINDNVSTDVEDYPSGFNAFGKVVPAHRQKAGYDLVKEFLPDVSTEIAHTIIGKCSNYILRDNTFAIIGAISDLDKELDLIDLTGRYRLLAVLTTN